MNLQKRVHERGQCTLVRGEVHLRASVHRVLQLAWGREIELVLQEDRLKSSEVFRGAVLVEERNVGPIKSFERLH